MSQSCLLFQVLFTAALNSAGGLGVIGGLRYTPKMLRSQIRRLKAGLDDPAAPFGVDLLFPQIGGTARKTVTMTAPILMTAQIREYLHK